MIRDRQQGKTLEIARILASNPKAVCIVLDQRRKEYLLKAELHVAPPPGTALRIFTLAQVRNRQAHFPQDCYLMIEDAEQVIGELLRLPTNIDLITATGHTYG